MRILGWPNDLVFNSHQCNTLAGNDGSVTSVVQILSIDGEYLMTVDNHNGQIATKSFYQSLIASIFVVKLICDAMII